MVEINRAAVIGAATMCLGICKLPLMPHWHCLTITRQCDIQQLRITCDL